MRTFRVRAGFTLIELLVVIAIIALLIAFMLPVIARAKEQGKQVKCNANLKQIGTAMRFYGTETNDWFPFEKHNNLNAGAILHGFYYGGHPGRNYNNSDIWWGYIQRPYRDTPRGRPFNRYLYSELPNWDVQPSDKGLFEGVRDMPAFSCTNDTGPFWMTSQDHDDQPHSRSLYKEAGSSYDLNYHFSWNWSARSETPRRWLQRSNAYLKKQMFYWASTFIIIYEDPFDSALWSRLTRRGWHRQIDRHNVLFLDGHAANALTRTKNANSGTGWKTGSGNSSSDGKAWWNNKDDPDYQYRNIDPLPGW
jgi:prepilin-type N-terminal cleavage/methylation domain-containing protein/prepilin-type processing-associated H-X9-DG protein